MSNVIPMGEYDPYINNEHELIEVLGGIKHVIAYYKEKNLVTDSQKKNIVHLTSSSSPIPLNTNEYTGKKVKSQESNFNIYCHQYNTIIHKIFKQQTANYLYHIISSKYSMHLFIGFVIALCLTAIITIWSSYADIIFCIFYYILTFMIVIFMLSANINIGKRMLLSFETFFKTSNTTVAVICGRILSYNRSNGMSNEFFMFTIAYMGLILITICFSIIDAFKINRKIQSIGLILWTALFLSDYFVVYFLLHDDVKIFSMSVRTLYLSSLLNLILFFGRESFFSFVFRNSNKCVLIRSNPNIIWKN